MHRFSVAEELARETGGTVIRVDGAGIEAIERGLCDAEAVLRKGKVQEGEVNVAPLPKKIVALGEKSQPPFAKFLDAMRFRSIKELLDSPPQGLTVVPFYVEEGAQLAKFSSFYPADQWLYLLDPDGAPIDFSAPRNALIRPSSPFTSAKVRAPKVGRWWAIITGATGAAPVKALYLAMVDNRDVVLAGGCRPVAAVGEAVDFWASATFRDRLSGLRVKAEIVAPNGARHPIDLSDSGADDPGSGEYLGLFIPEAPGPYRYTIRISSRGNASLAGSMHRLLHAEPKKNSNIPLAAKAPAFVRLLTGYFDVGKRPIPKDHDQRYRGLGGGLSARGVTNSDGLN